MAKDGTYLFKKMYRKSINDRFAAGQLYRIRHGTFYRTMRVESVGDGFVRFIDVNDSRVKCSGEIFTLRMPTCQSCSIDGCDMVYSYDVQEV